MAKTWHLYSKLPSAAPERTVYHGLTFAPNAAAAIRDLGRDQYLQPIREVWAVPGPDKPKPGPGVPLRISIPMP
jgi:hypothetical protein